MLSDKEITLENIEKDRLVRDRVLNPNSYLDKDERPNCYSPAIEDYALICHINEVLRDDFKMLKMTIDEAAKNLRKALV